MPPLSFQNKRKSGKETGFVCGTSFDKMKMEGSLMITAQRGRQAVGKAMATLVVLVFTPTSLRPVAEGQIGRCEAAGAA